MACVRLLVLKVQGMIGTQSASHLFHYLLLWSYIWFKIILKIRTIQGKCQMGSIVLFCIAALFLKEYIM